MDLYKTYSTSHEEWWKALFTFLGVAILVLSFTELAIGAMVYQTYHRCGAFWVSNITVWLGIFEIMSERGLSPIKICGIFGSVICFIIGIVGFVLDLQWYIRFKALKNCYQPDTVAFYGNPNYNQNAQFCTKQGQKLTTDTLASCYCVDGSTSPYTTTHLPPQPNAPGAFDDCEHFSIKKGLQCGIFLDYLPTMLLPTWALCLSIAFACLLYGLLTAYWMYNVGAEHHSVHVDNDEGADNRRNVTYDQNFSFLDNDIAQNSPYETRLKISPPQTTSTTPSGGNARGSATGLYSSNFENNSDEDEQEGGEGHDRFYPDDHRGRGSDRGRQNRRENDRGRGRGGRSSSNNTNRGWSHASAPSGSSLTTSNLRQHTRNSGGTDDDYESEDFQEEHSNRISINSSASVQTARTYNSTVFPRGMFSAPVVAAVPMQPRVGGSMNSGQPAPYSGQVHANGFVSTTATTTQIPMAQVVHSRPY